MAPTIKKNDMGKVQLSSERLVLTPISTQDLDIYTRLLTCPKTTQYLPGGKPFTAAYIENYLVQKLTHWEKGYGTFVIQLKSEPGTKIGYVGVEEVKGTGFNDIRYAITPEHYGKGLAFEAAELVCEYMFTQTTVQTIYGVAVKDNKGSNAILNKLKMKPSTAILYDSDDLLHYQLEYQDYLAGKNEGAN